MFKTLDGRYCKWCSALTTVISISEINYDVENRKPSI